MKLAQQAKSLIKQSGDGLKKADEACDNFQKNSPKFSTAVIVLGLLGVLWGIGDWLDIITNYFIFVFTPAFLLLAGWWFHELYRSQSPGTTQPASPNGAGQSVATAANSLLAGWSYRGLGIAVGAYLLTVLYLGKRIPIPDTLEHLIIVWAVFTVLAGTGLWILWRVLTVGNKTQFDMARVGIIVSSGLLAWLLSSATYSVVTWFAPALNENTASLKTTVKEREDAVRSAASVTVAVALSGGGYRAATIHAGVLKVLDNGDEKTPRIPIRYLSTVSGGSIVGAYYALGHRPQEFIQFLESSKPGFANDLFHIWHMAQEFFGPRSMRDSDTYANHFRRVYFGPHTFANVASPTLIVNATSYSGRSRAIFTSHLTPQVSIADAVAASGAFPGAFEPKLIDGKDYIDGGVVENLGLEGLREFLAREADTPQQTTTPPTTTPPTCRPNLPDVLIISDASQADKDPEGGRKELRLTLLKEASSTSYLALHRKLYRLFTNNRYDPEIPAQQPFFQGRQHLFDPNKDGHECYLFTFVLDSTSLGERRDMEQAGAKPAKVAKFSTLKELDKEEVEMGVTLGETIAKKYLTVIGCVIRKIPALKRGEGMSPEAIQQACRDKVRT